LVKEIQKVRIDVNRKMNVTVQGFKVQRFRVNETANSRISNIEPQNFEGWFHVAQFFL